MLLVFVHRLLCDVLFAASWLLIKGAFFSRLHDSSRQKCVCVSKSLSFHFSIQCQLNQKAQDLVSFKLECCGPSVWLHKDAAKARVR